MKKIFAMVLLLCIYQSAWAAEIKLSCSYTGPFNAVSNQIYSFDEEARMYNGNTINRNCKILTTGTERCTEGTISDTTIRWDHFYDGELDIREEIDRGSGELTRTYYEYGVVKQTPDGIELIYRGSCSPFKKAF